MYNCYTGKELSTVLRKAIMMSLVTLVFLFACTVLKTEAGTISQSPESQVSFEGKRVTFTCVAEGSTFWLLNGSVYTFLNDEEFSNNGFSFRDDYQSGPVAMVLKTMTVVASSRNNNTNVSCIAIGSSDGTRNSSPDASLTVIGSPADVRYLQINDSAFNVSWRRSYAPDGYEIQNYTIRVINATNGDLSNDVFAVKTILASQNVDRYSFVYSVNEQRLPLLDCSWFIFTVTAANRMSESLPVNVSWQKPLDFGAIEKSKCVQTSQVDGTTTLHVQFDFPKQCRFQDIHYHIDVSENGGRDKQSLQSTSTRIYNGANSHHFEEDIEQLMLEEGKVYLASVVFERAGNRSVMSMEICSWRAGSIKLPDSHGLLNSDSSKGESSNAISGGTIALLVICIVVSVTLTGVSLIILVLFYSKVKQIKK